MKALVKKQNVTTKLDDLFDQFGVGVLSVNLARDAAEAIGLNRTSAEIRFYRWQALRIAEAKQSL